MAVVVNWQGDGWGRVKRGVKTGRMTGGGGCKKGENGGGGGV